MLIVIMRKNRQRHILSVLSVQVLHSIAFIGTNKLHKTIAMILLVQLFT